MNLDPTQRKTDPREEYLINYSRDLCVCTEEELRSRWMGRRLEALNYVLEDSKELSFEQTVTGHNPIYFLAQELFFDDQRNNPVFLYPPYHKDTICKAALDYYLVKSRDRGLLLLAPRGTYKSTLFHGAVPMWVVLREYWLNEKFVRVALIHHKDDMAHANLDRVRQVMAHHEWFKRIWKECSARESVLGSTIKVRLPNAPKGHGAVEANFEAGGMGGSLTGSHYNAIFFSDLVTEDHQFSETLRRETEEKHKSMKYLLDRVGGRRFYDGTMYHPHDLWNTFLSANDKHKRPVYRSLVISAGYEKAKALEAEGKPFEHVLTHPFLWSMEHMEEDREEFVATYGNDDFFFAQIENKIRTARHIMTDLSWIGSVKAEDIHPNAQWGLFIDPAWKGTDSYGKGDFASIQVWAFEMRGSMVIRTLVDGIHSNELSPGDGLKAIVRLQDKYNIYFIAPEQTGVSGIRQVIEDEFLKLGVPVEVVKLKDTFSSVKGGGQKGRRISSFIGECEKNRSVFMAEECDPVLRAAFEYQFENYMLPDSLRHDDAIDCASFTMDAAVREIFQPHAAQRNRQGVLDSEGTKGTTQFRTRYCLT